MHERKGHAHILVCNQDIHDTADDVALMDHTSHPWFGEMFRIFENLGYTPVIHVLHVDNYRTTLDALGATTDRDIIIHSCDGIEHEPFVKGCDVADCLTTRDAHFIGASADFDRLSADKRVMKQRFVEQNVPTPKFVGVDGWDESIEPRIARAGLVYPLFVKVAKFCSAWGIANTSVVRSPSELRQEIERLTAELSGEIVVEEFIEGPEFTCVVFEGARGPEAIKPALEYFKYEKKGAQDTRFFSDDDMTQYLQTGDFVVDYRAVPDKALERRIMRTSEQAFASLNGTGWGRVDLRMKRKTGESVVLEVNASPGLGKDTKIDKVLALHALTWEVFFKEIISAARKRRSVR